MTARVLVHADGGACHGTPIVDGRCPKCGIAPDTQSVELWPAPAAASDKKPGDAFYAFADALPSPPTMLLVTSAERQPCGGWYEASPGRWWLDAGPLTADASGDPGHIKWSVEVGERSWARGSAPTLEAAQLAAEDALLAVADEIRRAVGR